MQNNFNKISETTKKASGPFNVIIVRRHGKVHNYSIAVSSVFLFLFLFLLICVFSILGIWKSNQLFSFWQNQKQLLKENQTLENQVLKLEEKLIISQSNLLELEIGNDKPSLSQVTELIPIPQKINEKLQKTKLAEEIENQTTETQINKLDKNLESLTVKNAVPEVNVGDLELKVKSNNELEFIFKLNKNMGVQNQLQGYIWLLAEFKNEDQSLLLRSAPEDELNFKNNFQYEKGQYFAIRNGKIVKTVINDLPIKAKLHRVVVLVWSTEGDLILKNFLSFKTADE